jgi:hypothetical protein
MNCSLSARCSAIFFNIVPRRVVRSPRHPHSGRALPRHLQQLRLQHVLPSLAEIHFVQRLLARLAIRRGHVF